MKNPFRRPVAVAVVFLLSLVAFACTGCERVLIEVDGRKILASRFRNEVDSRLQRVKARDPAELTGKKGVLLKAETERQVATELIRREILLAHAGKLGIKISSEEIARAISDQERAGKNSAGKKERARASKSELRELVLEKILLERISEKVTSGVSVSDEEAESFYLTRSSEYARPAMFRMAHILIETETEAKIVYERLRCGEDFSSLARMLSVDRSTKEAGGDMGWLVSGSIDPALENAVVSMRLGEVSMPIRCSDGYHIVKLLDRKEGSTLPFEEVKNRVLGDLLNMKKQEMLSEWLKTAFANAEVRLPGSIGRWDPALGMVVSAY